MSDELLENWEQKSKERQKLYKTFLGRKHKNDIIYSLPDLHEEAFEKLNEEFFQLFGFYKYNSHDSFKHVVRYHLKI